MEWEKNGNPVALLPMGVFLVIVLVSAFLTRDIYATPLNVAFFIALWVAFLQNRKLGYREKMMVVARSVGDENIVTMCLVFLCAGAFSGAVRETGDVEHMVNLGLSILPADKAVGGLFLVSCFLSISMGTSVGTITALAPIATGIHEKTGFTMALCTGAVVCGAMFGDNLSQISDTTIAAVKTQGCEMRDKFKENFLIVMPAALITLVIYFRMRNEADVVMEGLPYRLVYVVPYLVVFLGALWGMNVFLVLLGGTLVSLLVGVGTGSMKLGESLAVVGDGMREMYEIIVISIIVTGVVSLMREQGGIRFALDLVRRRIRSPKGAELGIAGLALLVDICTANNTVAIVIAGPIAKEISSEFGIAPKRSASLLDIFSSVGQGVIPYGAQILAAASLTGVSPLAIIPYLYYPIFMAVSAVLFVLLRKR